MADGSVTIEVGLSKDQFDKDVKSVKNDLNSLGNISTKKAFDGISSGLKGIGNVATSAGKACSVVTGVVGGVFASAGAKAKNFIGVYEGAIAVFQRSLGKTGADEMYNSLLKIAKGSRFAQENIVSAGQVLVAMGVNANDTAKYVQIATNAMSGMGKSGADVEAMAEMFGKMSMQTTLYTEDLNQMLTNGIRVYDILSTKYHTNADAIKKMASEGKLGAEDFKYLTDVLQGNVVGMEQFSIAGMALAGKTGTLMGALDSLNSSFRTFALNLLDIDPRTEQGRKSINGLIQVIQTLGAILEDVGSKFSFVGGWIRDFIGKLATVTTTVDESGNTITTYGGILGELKNKLDSLSPESLQAIAKAILGMAAAGPILLGAGKGFDTLGDAVSKIGGASEKFNSFLSKTTSKLIEMPSSLQNVTENVKEFGSSISTMFSGGMFDKIENSFTTFFDKIGSVMSSVGTKILAPLQGLGDKIGTLLSPVTATFQKFILKTSTFGQLLKFNIGETISNLFPNVSAGLNKIAGAFGNAFSGILSKVVKFAPKFLSVFTTAFNITAIIGVLVVGLGLLSNTFGEKIDEIISIVIEKGPQIITNFANSIMEKLPELMYEGSQMVLFIVEAITANLPAIINAGMSIVSELVLGISGLLPDLIPMAVELVMTIVNSIIENLPAIINAGIELLLGLIQGIVNAIPQLTAMLPTIVNTIVTVLIENLPMIIEAGIEILVALIDGLANALPQLIAMLPQIIVTIVNCLIQHLPQIMNAGVQILFALIRGIVSILSSLTQCAWEIIKTIGNVLKELPNQAIQWAKDFMKGFVDGIKSMLGSVGDAASSVGNKIKEFLHFSRPDKGPLREYEKWMPDMIKGMSSSMRRATPKLYNASKELAEKISDGLDISNAYNKLQTAISLETGKINTMIASKVMLEEEKNQPRTVQNDNGVNINNTQNFYNKEASPYEEQKEAKQQLRRLAYGL